MKEFEDMSIWQQLPLMIIAVFILAIILLFPIYTSIIPLYYYYQGIIEYNTLMALLMAIIAFDAGLVIMVKLLSKVVKVEVTKKKVI